MLDPKNWNDFRNHSRSLLDTCIDYLENARDNFWRPVDDDARKLFSPPLSKKGQKTEDVIASLQKIMQYSNGNTHPRFFGWVHGTGLANTLLADMAISTMNSNCGGRDHGAIYIERTVINWCIEIFGLLENSSGILTPGTSQATLIALTTARVKALGKDFRKEGIAKFPELRVYCAEGTHACVEKTLQVMGHGSDALQKIPALSLFGGIDVQKLQSRIEKDKANGIIPLCVVATAGSVNTGAFDNIDAVADICAKENIWLHIDGAFGAWAHIAEAPWCNLTKGIERADSIAFDFHKWMYMQYGCGAVIIRDPHLHYDSFSMPSSADYLKIQEGALSGGDPWYCNLGIDLSRDFKALKVWTALQEYGLDAFSEAITKNCKQAAYMGELINNSVELELAAPVISNICVFFAKKEGTSEEEQDKLNEVIVHKLQVDRNTVFSTTKLNNRIVIRAAIVNHRTEFEDIDIAISSVLEASSEIIIKDRAI